MRKKQYLESKATYSVTIKREKIRSWKGYCNMTTATSPWTVVYTLAVGKEKCQHYNNSSTKSDGTLTDNTEETLRLMMDNFTPEDNEREDNEYHKIFRSQFLQPPTHMMTVNSQ